MIFEMVLLWEDSLLMSHFLSYKRGGFPLLQLVTQVRKNMVEGKEPRESPPWHCDSPVVHSFIQKTFVEQTVLGTEELGHRTGKVLALLELVFTWGDRWVGDLACRSPQSRLAAVRIHSFGQYLRGLQGPTSP